MSVVPTEIDENILGDVRISPIRITGRIRHVEPLTELGYRRVGCDPLRDPANEFPTRAAPAASTLGRAAMCTTLEDRRRMLKRRRAA